jgi:mRNA-degrading endonuclease RelE of RelBE toxin-antitoxin system
VVSDPLDVTGLLRTDHPGDLAPARLDRIAEHPRPAGKPLVGELAGLYSARRGDYRVVHEIDDDRKVVIVHRVQHRRVAYRPR